MELFERRRYYYCRYCGTFHFLDVPAVEGIQVLERAPDAPSCPVCHNRLARSLLDNVHVVEHCDGCRGALMARATFAQAVSHRRAWASGSPAPPTPIDQRELLRQVSCPSCGRPMDVHPYYGPGNVVIDTCSACDMVWLDYGELKQITDAPGQDRGTRAAPATLESWRSEQSASKPDSDSEPISLIDALDELFGLR